MITVFYDDLCGLCSKEIRTYQHADKKEQFLWQSLSDPNLNLDKESFDLVMALEQLHVKDNSKHLHVGVGAFIVIWGHLPLWSLLARIASIRPIHWVLSIIYARFAKRRFHKLAHCQIALKQQLNK